MKLLIVTQKIDKNDPILGFFHRWVEEFAKNVESVKVICLEKGSYDLPENVEVYSLGKEKRKKYPPTGGLRKWVADSKDGWKLEIFTEIWVRILYTIRFYTLIWKMRDQYDSVFVHMNPAYIVLGGLYWRILGKRIGLWYTHKNVDLKLRIAEFFTHTIFTASKESFRLKSKKVLVTGHGIDVERFISLQRTDHKGILKIVVVGRISKIKGAKYIVEVCNILKKNNIIFELSFVGDPVTKSDILYFDELKDLIIKYSLNKNISFKGSIPNNKIIDVYSDADITMNPLPAGGMDKVVLEAMSSGVIPFTSNPAFEEFFGEYSKKLIFEYENAEELAEKIMSLLKNTNTSIMRGFLMKKAQKSFDIKTLIQKIVKTI